MQNEHIMYYYREIFSLLGLMCHLWTLKLHYNGCSITCYIHIIFGTYTKIIHLE